MDLLDPLAPIIPSILAAPKAMVSENPYFIAKRKGERYKIQLFPRMEGLNLWGELRKRDVSGLTPDESAVVSGLLEGARGKILGVTDYPQEESRIIQFGSKVYYESETDVEEFVANLRTVERKNRRNSYVPRSSIIEARLSRRPSANWTAQLVNSLGEWCFLLL